MMQGQLAVARHVCAAYGLAAGSGPALAPVSRGAMGRIWRLDCAAGRFAVKELFSAEVDEAAVRQEARCTAAFAAGGIRLPGSLAGPDGRFLSPVPPRLGGGWLRLYQWADGTPVSLTSPGRPGPAPGGHARSCSDLADRVGTLLGRLHALAPSVPPAGQAHPWYDSVPGPAEWQRLTAAAVAAAVPWGTALAGQAGRLAELATLVTPAGQHRPGTCHRDLHPDNVLVAGDGELVLLDWDNLGPACQDRELATVLWRWHVSDGALDAGAVRRNLAAYRAAGGQGRLRDQQSFGMLIACSLNFLHVQASAAVDPDTDPEHREFAVREIRESLDMMPALPLLAELIRLDAAQIG